MTDPVQATSPSSTSQGGCARWTNSFLWLGKMAVVPLSWIASKFYKPQRSVDSFELDPRRIEQLTDPKCIVEQFSQEPYHVLYAFVSLLVTNLPAAEAKLRAILLDYKAHPEKYQTLRSVDYVAQQMVLSPTTLEAYKRFETFDYATGQEEWRDHELYREGQRKMDAFNKKSIGACVYDYCVELFPDVRLPSRPKEQAKSGISVGRLFQILQQQRDIGCLAGVKACRKWLGYIEAIVLPQLINSPSGRITSIAQLAQPLFTKPEPVAEMISRLVVAYMPELQRTRRVG